MLHRFSGSSPSLDIEAHLGTGCPSGNQITAISFTFKTSDDDLRGRNDNLNITVLFADGTSQPEPNVNHSQNWQDGSTKGAEIQLNRQVEMNLLGVAQSTIQWTKNRRTVSCFCNESWSGFTICLVESLERPRLRRLRRVQHKDDLK